MLNSNTSLSKKYYSTTIDLSSSEYDQNTWYPVVSTMLGNYFKIWSILGISGTPSWSTHNNGFSCVLELSEYGSSWGMQRINTIILRYSCDFTLNDINPVSYTQLRHTNEIVFFCRGGGKYYIETTGNGNWHVKTSKYDSELGESVDLCNSCPKIAPDELATVYANINNAVITRYPPDSPYSQTINNGNINITSPGIYSIASTIDEISDSTMYGTLIVFRGQYDRFVTQILSKNIDDNKNCGLYMRCMDSEYEWGKWTKFYNALEIDNKLKTIISNCNKLLLKTDVKVSSPLTVDLKDYSEYNLLILCGAYQTGATDFFGVALKASNGLFLPAIIHHDDNLIQMSISTENIGVIDFSVKSGYDSTTICIVALR